MWLQVQSGGAGKGSSTVCKLTDNDFKGPYLIVFLLVVKQKLLYPPSAYLRICKNTVQKHFLLTGGLQAVFIKTTVIVTRKVVKCVHKLIPVKNAMSRFSSFLRIKKFK